MPTELSSIRTSLSRSWLRHLRPLKFDRYILAEVVLPFFGGLVFLSFVFLMFQALRLAEFFIVHGVSLALLGEISSLMLLSFLPYSVSIAFLIAVLSAFGRLSADSELVAMKANGVSVWRMAAPGLVVGTVVSIISLGLNMNWVPWAEHRYRELIVKIGNTKATSSIKEGTFTTGFFDLLIFTDKLDRATNKMQRVFIYDEREPKNPVTVIAQEGQIQQVLTGADLAAAIQLKLYSGNIHRSSLRENIYSKIDFDEYKLYLTVPEGSGGLSFRPRIVPQPDLLRRIAENDPNQPMGRELRTEFWRRYTTSIMPLIFVFLGIGFGTVRTRAVRASAALVGLLVVLLYWSMQAVFTSAGYDGWLPPFVAMLFPNLIVGVLAVFGFRSAMW